MIKVYFPFPPVWDDWVDLMERLIRDGYEVDYKGDAAFVMVETESEAVEFKLRYL